MNKAGRKNVIERLSDSNKITIALLVDSFYPNVDGVVVVVNHYATLLKDKANIIVICPNHHKYKDNDDYLIYRASSLQVPFIDGYDFPMPTFDITLKKLVKELKIDLVHIHSPFYMGALGVKIANAKNIPLIATMHSQFKQNFQDYCKVKFIVNLLMNKIMKVFNRCDEVWVANEGTKKLFIEEYKFKGRVELMSNATEMLPLDSSKCRKAINEKYGINDDEKVLLFVGRLVLVKNIMFIADALIKLKDKMDFKMIFVGDDIDRAALEQKLQNGGVFDKVIMTGKVFDRDLLAQIYNRADLLLFPSLYDTDGLVKREAASQHTPTILLKEAIASCGMTDKVDGFLAESDIDKFAEYIYEILNNKKLLEDVSQNAFDNIYFTWENVVAKAFDRYKFLIEEKSKRQK